MKTLITCLLSFTVFVAAIAADQKQQGIYRNTITPVKATPKVDLVFVFPIQEFNRTIYQAEKFRLVKERSDDYIVEMNNGDEEMLVSLKKTLQPGLKLTIERDGLVSTRFTHDAVFDEAYFILEKGVGCLVNRFDDKFAIVDISSMSPLEYVRVDRKYLSLISDNSPKATTRGKLKKTPLATRELNSDNIQDLLEDVQARETSIFREVLKVNEKLAELNSLVEPLDNKTASAVENFLNPWDAVCVVKTKHATGTGFLANLNGLIYVITNIHVILGEGPIVIKRMNGETIEYNAIELSEELDLARISVSDVFQGLPFTDAISVGDYVKSLGNNDGAGVITEENGMVIGISGDKVEVTADFVQGSSGGPLLNRNNEVIGVSTYVSIYNEPENWVKANTRYNEVRRFGLRVGSHLSWVNVHPESLPLLAKFTSGSASEVSKNSLFSILNISGAREGAKPVTKFDSGGKIHTPLKRWIKERNKLVEFYFRNVLKSTDEVTRLNWILKLSEKNSASFQGLEWRVDDIIFALEKLEPIPEVQFVTQNLQEEINFWKEAKRFLSEWIPAIRRNISIETKAEENQLRRQIISEERSRKWESERQQRQYKYEQERKERERERWFDAENIPLG